jgi:polyhydroxybutyrate depolymerase
MRLFLFLILLCLSTQAFACGDQSDCMVGERSYRIAMPPGVEPGSVPAILHVHGFRGRASGTMRNMGMRRLAREYGVALIAVQSDGPGWDVPNNPRNPDSDGQAELAYFDAVRADAVARFGLDPERIIATGFSSGAMMIWNLACARPQDYLGFVPVAGTFWKAPPESCTAPAANIMHIHGDNDTVVPLMGRAIRSTRQGAVPEALQMYAAFGEFDAPQSTRYPGLACKQRTNPEGAVLEFCIFSGAHAFRTDHLRIALDLFRSQGRF